jgi:hypothetical protein
MAAHGRHRLNDRRRTARRRGIAAVALGLGLAAATGHDVAWADTAAPSDNPAGPASPGVTGPKKPSIAHLLHHLQDASSTATKPARAGASDDIESANSAATEQDSVTDAPRTRSRRNAGDGDSPTGTAPKNLPARFAARAENRIAAALSASKQPGVDATAVDARTAAPETAITTTFAAAVVTPTTVTTPDPPGPLSPISKIIAAPGRFINVVLQTLDITTSSRGPQSPLDFAPIDEALFAAFRRTEDLFGLDKPPAVQPVISHQEYDLPDDAEKTPTVAQFLNAAAGEYVLGGSPAGLKPFTVDGKQLTSTNVLSGESAQAWVTPDNQIIIAYQGTTGGTNLLVDPLIAITQIVTDTQIIFTGTTPQAFHDSLAFEQQVESAATDQGYDKSDIFVTGHSLGGWEAQYVAQQTGLGGIGFEGPGINTIVPGNGADSGFVNVETYGDTAAYFATDLPGLQPFVPAYVPGGGSKPHYGSIIMIGDPTAAYPLMNAASLWGPNPVGDVIFAVDILGNFFEHHLPGMQAYNLDVDPDPGVVPWLGATTGDINDGWGELTIPELKAAASDAGVLITP